MISTLHVGYPSVETCSVSLTDDPLVVEGGDFVVEHYLCSGSIPSHCAIEWSDGKDRWGHDPTDDNVWVDTATASELQANVALWAWRHGNTPVSFILQTTLLHVVDSDCHRSQYSSNRFV